MDLRRIVMEARKLNGRRICENLLIRGSERAPGSQQSALGKVSKGSGGTRRGEKEKGASLNSLTPAKPQKSV